MGTPPLMVDILPEIAGVDFDRAWRRRVVETIDANAGLKVNLTSADDLIAAKLASGRAGPRRRGGHPQVPRPRRHRNETGEPQSREKARTQAAAQVKILQRLGGVVAHRRETLEWQ